MPLKTRLRRALGRASPDSTRTSSTVSSASTSATDVHHLENVLTTTPVNVPAITLTKTSSRLSKITSWRAEKKKDKWVEPKSKFPGRRDSKTQDVLRQFEMRFGRQGRPSIDGRWSIWSGVSPTASRQCSVDEGLSSLGGLALSRRASREAHTEVETVAEE